MDKNDFYQKIKIVLIIIGIALGIYFALKIQRIGEAILRIWEAKMEINYFSL